MLITLDKYSPDLAWAVFEPELLGAQDLYLVSHQSRPAGLAGEVADLSRVGSVVAWHRGIEISETEAGYHATGFSLVHLDEKARSLEARNGTVDWFRLAQQTGLEPETDAPGGAELSRWGVRPERDAKHNPIVSRIGQVGRYTTDSKHRSWEQSLAEVRHWKVAALAESGWRNLDEVHRAVHEVTQTTVGAAPYHFLNLVCPETRLAWVLDTLGRQRLMAREGREYVAAWDGTEGPAFIDQQWGWTWFVDCEGGRSAEVELAAKLWRAVPAMSGDDVEEAVRAVAAGSEAVEEAAKRRRTEA